MKLKWERKSEDLFLVARHWLQHNINTDVLGS
jgi:hypothetical protein